jgi:hypothetical protein
LVHSAFNHLMQLLAQGSFTEKNTYFHEIQRCILSCSRCILVDPTVCQFNKFTIHNWCSYCCFMVFCSASHMVTFLHIPQLSSAKLPSAIHPTHFTLNHTLWRSLTAVMHLM